MKIVDVKFEKPSRMSESKAIATLEDGSEVVAFHFFDDELSFTKSELIGLTAEEARQLKIKKDIQYLQS